MKKLGLGKVRAWKSPGFVPYNTIIIEPTFIQLGMRTHTENSQSHTSNVRYIAFSMKSDLSSYHLA